jgi:hypothetical protein
MLKRVVLATLFVALPGSALAAFAIFQTNTTVNFLLKDNLVDNLLDGSGGKLIAQ